MSKELDDARDREELIKEKSIEQIRKAADINPGVPGECDFCGEHFSRLINDACGGCRDRYKL